jgi:hypothetical protein
VRLFHLALCHPHPYSQPLTEALLFPASTTTRAAAPASPTVASRNPLHAGRNAQREDPFFFFCVFIHPRCSFFLLPFFDLSTSLPHFGRPHTPCAEAVTRVAS